MDLLRELFPSHAVPVLVRVLDQHGGNVDAAADFLFSGGVVAVNHDSVDSSPSLSMSKPSSAPSIANPPRDNNINNIAPNTPVVSPCRGMLRECLARFVDSTTYADIELIADNNVSLWAHRLVLSARSAVLASLLITLPLNTARLDLASALGLKEVPPSALRTVLEYLYTDNCEVAVEDAFVVYNLADALALSRLCERCELGTWPKSPSTFIEEISALLDDQNCDVLLKIDEDTTIRVHKLFLCAASDYFRAMLSGSMTEARTQTVVLKDCSVDFFEFMVACLYSDGEASSRISGENALEYFLLANEYMLPSIQSACESLLKENLEVESVAEVYQLTSTTSASLRFSTLQFMFAHFDEVTASSEWAHVKESTRKELYELYSTQKSQMFTEFLSLMTPEVTEFLSQKISGDFAQFISNALQNFKVEEVISGETDESELGSVSYKLQNFKLEAPYNRQIARVRDVNVEIDTASLQLGIFVSHMAVVMNQVLWNYEERKFPNVRDSGEAKMTIENISLSVVFRIFPSAEAIPQLDLVSFDLESGAPEPDLRHGKMSWVYRVLQTICRGELRHRLRDALQVRIRQLIPQFIGTVNQMVSQGARESKDESSDDDDDEGEEADKL